MDSIIDLKESRKEIAPVRVSLFPCLRLAWP